MAVGVIIYGTENDEVIACGCLYLEGGVVKASDPSDVRLQTILSEPAAGPKTGMRPVTAQQDPLAFLANLASTYRGIALRAGPLQEIDRPEAPGLIDNPAQG